MTKAPPTRPYQDSALAAVRSALDSGVNRQLVQMATGCGKTRTVAELPHVLEHWLGQFKEGDRRMWMIAHREELLDQAAAALQAANPGRIVMVEQGDRHASPYADFVVASIQTLAARRYARLKKLLRHGPPRIVVCDEAHHSPSATYRTTLTHLGFLPTSVSSDTMNIESVSRDDVEVMTRELAGWDKVSPKDRVLVGITATPNRSDAVGLSCIFQSIVFMYGLKQAIADGWLAPIVAWSIETQTSLDAVRTTAGEFNQRDLGEAVNNAVRNELGLSAWRAHAEDRPTLGFTVDVAHAHACKDLWRSAGYRVEAVSGETPKEDRRIMLRQYQSGQIQVLFNCQVLCLDEQTEILTDAGWVGINGMTYQHKVANWDDGRVFFEPPKFIVRRERDRDEPMVSYSSDRHVFRVTNRHRMLVKQGPGFEIRHAEDCVGTAVTVPLCGLAEPIDVPLAFEDEGPACSDRRRVASHAYELRKRGWPAETSHAEAERRIAERKGLHRKHARELTVAECEFIGFWIGDGSVNHLRKGGLEYTACQATRYPDIIRWFDHVIASCGFHALKKPHPGSVPAVRWSFPRGTGWGTQRRAGVYPIEPFLVKGPNPLLWGLNREQFEAVIRGFAYADGPHAAQRRSYEIGGADIDLFDQLQAIAVCRGFSATLHRVGIPKKVWHRPQATLRIGPWQERRIGAGRAQVTKEEKWVPERVWCVTSTSGNIITRRNGHVTVTGNTEGTDLPLTSCVLLMRPTKSATLLEQIVGRGLRRLDSAGKTDCVVIDLVDVARRHSLQTVPSLYGLPTSVLVKGKKLNDQAEEFEDLMESLGGVSIEDMLKAGRMTLEQLGALAKRVDVFWQPRPLGSFGEGRRVQWICIDDTRYHVSYPWSDGTETVEVVADLVGKWEVSTTVKPSDPAQPKRQKTIAVGCGSATEAAEMAEAFITSQRASVMKLKAVDAPWMERPASSGQIGFLKKLGVQQVPPKLSMGQASQWIDRIKASKGAR